MLWSEEQARRLQSLMLQDQSTPGQDDWKMFKLKKKKSVSNYELALFTSMLILW